MERPYYSHKTLKYSNCNNVYVNISVCCGKIFEKCLKKKLMYEKGLLLIKKVKKGLIKWKNDDTNQLIELLEEMKCLWKFSVNMLLERLQRKSLFQNSG